MELSFVRCGALFGPPFLLYFLDEAGCGSSQPLNLLWESSGRRCIHQYLERKTESTLDASDRGDS